MNIENTLINQESINKMLCKKEESLNFIQNDNIYIYGVFDDSISKYIVPDLLKLIEDKKRIKKSSIHFYIESCGGYTYLLKILLAIIENAKNAGVIIKTFTFSMAYSCGSLLACAGTKGHRYISHDSENLLHLGGAGSCSIRTDKQLERYSTKAKSHFDFVREIYKKYAKVKDLEKVIKDDNYYIRGQEIIDNGLADKFYEKYG